MMGKRNLDYEVTLLLPKDTRELERMLAKAIAQIALKRLSEKEAAILIDRLEKSETDEL